MMKKRYKEEEISEMYGISMSKLRQDRLLKKGLPFIKIGKLVRYRHEDIEQFEESNLHDFKTIEDAIDKINAYEKLIPEILTISDTLNEIINLFKKDINPT